MTIEHAVAATAVLENEPDSTPVPETVKEPDSQKPLPIPTEEEVKENGLYYYFLSERDRALYKSARKTEGLREEIAMMRIKIAEVHVNDPANVAIFLRAISLLERLVRTHCRLFGTESERKAQTATNQMAQRFSPPDIRMNRAMRRESARAKG